MAFRNYLEGEDDKPYFHLNSLAHYYEEMQRYAALIKEMTGYIKDYGNELGLTKEEIDARLTAYILQNKAQLDQRLGEWDEKLQQFDGSVTDLLAEWVDDGTLNHIIDTTLIEQKVAPLTALLAEKVGGQVKLKPEEFSDEAMALVTGNGTVNVLSIPQEGSVTPTKTTFLSLGKNLFNKATVTVGGVLRTTLGDLLTNVNYDTSDFIEVLAETVYSRKTNGALVFYDANKAYISGIAAGGSLTITTPVNAKYLRLSMATVTGKEMEQVERNGEPTTYEPFIYKINDTIKVPFEDEIEKARGTSPDLNERILSLSNERKSRNLFNKETITPGVRLRPAVGDALANTYYDTSDFITVESSTSYSRKVNGDTVFYDVNKAYISGLASGAGKTFTTPSNAKYVRISMASASTTNDKEFEQFEKGVESTPYEPFGMVKETFKLSFWAGDKANFIGDSIVEGQAGIRYADTVGAVLGLAVARNYGIGGTSLVYRDTLHPGQNIDVNYPPVISRWQNMSDDAVLTFLGIGTNDYSSQVPLGSPDSLSETEFYGGLNIVLKGLKEKYPDKTLIVSTLLDRVPKPISTHPITIDQYNQAIINSCKKHKVICYRVHEESGMDLELDFTSGRKVLTTDGLHPNTPAGAKLLGRRIAGFINTK